jgi:hypothetical protein
MDFAMRFFKRAKVQLKNQKINVYPLFLASKPLTIAQLADYLLAISRKKL